MTLMLIALQRWLYHHGPGGHRLLRLFHRPRRMYHARRERRLRRRHPALLECFETRTFSQHGEDGILAEVFRRLSLTQGFFVECGVDGEENNTLALATQGWQGLWLEGSASCAARAHDAIVRHAVPVALHQCFVTRENILEVLEGHAVPADFDLLSMDIDGNDYWITGRILEHYRPKVVVVEYNAAFGPGDDFVVDYAPQFRWDRSHYFGAALKTLNSMMTRHGYGLAGCDRSGTNAFFVRLDLTQGRFAAPADPVAFFYRAPKYGLCWGHPPRRVIHPIQT